MNRKLEEYKVEILYLVGFSTDEIVKELHGRGIRRGPVNRLVTTRKLVAGRASETRAHRLVEIEREMPGLRIFIADAAKAGIRKANDDLMWGGMKRSERPERIRRRRLLLDMDLARSTVPEKIAIPEIRVRSGLTYNVGDCSLSFLASKALLPEWAVQAGLRLRQDRMAAGAGMAGMDYTKQKVDGGRAPGIGDAVLDAMQRGEDALSAVRYAFQGDELLPARIALLEHVAIHDRRIREFIAMPRAAMASASSLLAETLEAVAWVYKLAPSGPIANRMASWRPGPAKSDMEQAVPGMLDEAVLAHRLVKMAGA